MAERGISGETAETILRSISSFALYGFPESHAASFALIVYASAYLKAYYPAAFTTALLNNQPLGFYHPATLIKDAQRHGVRFLPVDVQQSMWLCHITPDGAVRLGFCMVQGLREEVGRKLERPVPTADSRLPTAEGQRPTPDCRPDGRVSDGRRPTAKGRLDERVSDSRLPTADCRDVICPKCGADDPSMLEVDRRGEGCHMYCGVCAHDWDETPGIGYRVPGAVMSSGSVDAPGQSDDGVPRPASRFSSVDALVAATGIRRDELNTLASLGALNAFGADRRGALWGAERAVRPTGDLFALLDEQAPPISVTAARRVPPDEMPAKAEGRMPTCPPKPEGRRWKAETPLADSRLPPPVGVPTKADGRIPTAEIPTCPPKPEGRRWKADVAGESPLTPMTPMERIVADYRGSGVTIGPHPMALRRADLRLRGVMRSDELLKTRRGRRVRVAGAVITRQRPGTAKGMVFLTLEDEAGLANVIIRPDVFDLQRPLILRAPFLVVEGVLQQQEGVTSVRAERVMGLTGEQPRVPSHDFR